MKALIHQEMDESNDDNKEYIDKAPPEIKLTQEEMELEARVANFPAETFITVCTWNMEKFGKTSEYAQKEAKANLAMDDILNVYHPTFFTMQEVTSAKLFEDETLDEPIDNYLMDLGDLPEKHFKKLSKDDKTELARMKEVLSKYSVSKEYGYAQGPLFIAGKSYKEYYPLYYDTSVVIGTPKPHLYDKRKNSLVPCPDQISFGTAAGSTPRPLIIWRCIIMIDNPNYVSSQKDSWQFVSTEVLLGIVHTSPSLPKNGGPTVCQQVKNILAEAKQIQASINKPFLLGGDFYANKYKSQWKVLQDKTKYELMAPDKATNFPHGASTGGQIADHLVGINNVTPYGKTLTVAPDLPFALEDHDETKNTPRVLSEIYDKMQADHCPVMCSMTLRYSD